MTDSFTLPATYYAVALCYFHHGRGYTRLYSRQIRVSGDSPLTADEAVARVRRVVEAEWATVDGTPLADWTFICSAVDSTILFARSQP